VALGLAGVALTAVLYPLLEASLGGPLAVFVLAPLGVAVLSDPASTRTVSIAAVLVAAVEGWAAGMPGWTLAVRVGIIATCTALGVLGATVRARREERVRRLELQQVMLETFQEGLVPSPSPPPGVHAASRYRPAEEPLRLGGDFVDVITLPDGAAGFVIGDVSGHGSRAAAFGSHLRAGWKGIAFMVPEQPDRWLEELDRAFFGDGRFDGFATVVTGRLCSDGALQAANAGHPPPVLRARHTNDAHYVELPPQLPLGIESATRRMVVHLRLHADRSMLLYTDGLIENARSPGGRAGESGLLQLLRGAEGALPLDDLLTRLGPEGFDDDVALLELAVG
jgi:serine phosphatase RsbU (regulator of sigma subunit)